MKRFRFLEYKFSDCHLNSGDVKVDAETLLNYLLAGRTVDSHQGKVKPFACGKTRVYFRAGALESIETIRQDYYAERAIQIQAWIRSHLLRQHFLALKQGMIRIQSAVRRWLARTFFASRVQHVVTIQCFSRNCIAKKELTRRRKENASTIIQTG
jgi:myosin heavy subunit